MRKARRKTTLLRKRKKIPLQQKKIRVKKEAKKSALMRKSLSLGPFWTSLSKRLRKQ